MATVARGKSQYWLWVYLALFFRLALIYFPVNVNLGFRPEVATPLTSLRRLAEGYWLKQSSVSPYAGSMYHGSPLLLPILGPLLSKRNGDARGLDYCSLLFVVADFVTALLIRATGRRLRLAYAESLKRLNLSKAKEVSDLTVSADVASLIYLWNPFTILTCLGSSTSPIENLMVALTLYGSCSRLAPLAAFGWVMATHLSLYPVILIVPVILLFGYGPDSPPKKLLLRKGSGADAREGVESRKRNTGVGSSVNGVQSFSWKPVLHFLVWAFIWWLYVLFLCGIQLSRSSSLTEMFKKTYGFILSVEDLSPNIGIFWYFFAEVFKFFEVFFLIVFHMNVLFMILPLAIRLKHRPCFLAFVYIAISSTLKTYPSIADSALYLSLLALFSNEMEAIRFSFFIFAGYIGVSLLSPVMHNLWIWRGTGNANFYFATGIAYACLQTVLVIESVSAMLNHDRMLGKRLLE